MLSAFVFGLVHLNLLQSSYAFILGLILGLVYIWFDSIWAAIVLHGAFNGTSVVTLYIFGDKEISELYFMIVSVIALLITILCMIVLAKERIREEKIENYDL
jgi:membrane protease YdiL (CAAX protease family)